MQEFNEKEKRQDFQKLLYELAKKPDLLKDKATMQKYYLELEKIYYLGTDEQGKTHFFRHFYSDIFTVLSEIEKDPSIGTIDVLGSNLEVLKNRYRTKNTDSEGNAIDVTVCLKKLFDHVSLDIARLNYIEGELQMMAGESSIKELNSKIAHIREDIDSFKETTEEIDAIRKDLAKSKNEYIAILGIFSSVVLSFTAGIAFSTSVFENIASASIYRTAFIVLLIGLVLLNAIFGLMHYIGILTEKKMSLKPVGIANSVIIVLMIVLCIAWFFGAAEYRDKKLHNKENIISTTSKVIASDIM